MNKRIKRTQTYTHRDIHSFIYFGSGSMAHKDNRQITIDNKRKTKVHNNRHIVDKWKRTDRDNKNDQVLLTCLVIIHANITYYRYKSVIAYARLYHKSPFSIYMTYST